MADRLAAKVAIVTGAGTRAGDGIGVGRATATLLAREGACVLVVDLEAENAEATRRALAEEGLDAADDCERLVDAAINRFGRLDVLVNCVGISCLGKVTEIGEEAWDRCLDVDLKSMVFTSKYAIPQMAAGGGGAWLVRGVRGALKSVQQISKIFQTFTIAITRSMAVHHGREGVRVNCIAPGLLYTPMVSERISPEQRELRRQAGPLGTEGTAWDVAWAAVFLASDESRWISGVVLPVDAGTLASTPLGMYAHLP